MYFRTNLRSITQKCLYPSSTPYLNSNSLCISCDVSNWSEQLKICVTCSLGQVYNNKINVRCECPPERPYYDLYSACVACDAENWNQGTRMCVTCGDGALFDKKNKACSCPQDEPVLEGTKCISCDWSNPIWNGDKCVSCPSVTYYSNQTQTCLRRPKNTLTTDENHECQQVSPI